MIIEFNTKYKNEFDELREFVIDHFLSCDFCEACYDENGEKVFPSFYSCEYCNLGRGPDNNNSRDRFIFHNSIENFWRVIRDNIIERLL